jgi:hypothetical protein
MSCLIAGRVGGDADAYGVMVAMVMASTVAMVMAMTGHA